MIRRLNRTSAEVQLEHGEDPLSAMHALFAATWQLGQGLSIPSSARSPRALGISDTMIAFHIGDVDGRHFLDAGMVQGRRVNLLIAQQDDPDTLVISRQRDYDISALDFVPLDVVIACANQLTSTKQMVR